MLLLISLAAVLIQASSCINVDVLMPNVSPKTKDSYLCYKFKLDEEHPMYITEFSPNSKKEVAHHMLLFGCEHVGNEEVWNCGEMNARGPSQEQYKSGPVCRGGQSIVYAWAMDAPKLTLPKDVAFKVGGNTKVKYLVLQVHYANVQKFIDGGVDASGVTLVAQHEPTTKTAGVYLLETDGSIKPRSFDAFEVACQMDENIEIHPFAFRTHAHKLGIVNSGYLVKTDKHTGKQDWVEIGRRSPQLPQMFYPATNQVTVKKNDILAARCTMKNYQDHSVSIGSTGDDEMCNFYIMYYVEGDKILNNNVCMSAGPPTWYFEDFEARDGTKLRIEVIPENASEAPVTDEKPVNHGNHEINTSDKGHEMNHQNTIIEPSNSAEESEEDEDVKDLERLEEDFILKKFFSKYFKEI